MGLATTERAAICDAFTAAGPDRATLCDGWTTRDLLAHLLVRERAPWASGGILVSALAPLTERAMRGWADTPWAEMIGKLRGGAPPWSPFAIGAFDAAANGVEFFVHHEDVRRGEPGWEPRSPDPDRDAQVWTALVRNAALSYRHAPGGVVLRTPDGREHVARPGTGVTVVGEPGELLLYAFGRTAARTTLEGTEADKAAFERVGRGV